MSSTAPFTASHRRGVIIAAAIAFFALAALVTGLVIIATAPSGFTLDASTTATQPVQPAALTAYTSPAMRRVTAGSTRYRTVTRGDTLALISQRAYGSVWCWPGLYRVNRGVIGGNPNVIEVGQRLVIPVSCDSRPVRFPAPRPVTHSITISTQHHIAQPTPAGSILGDVSEIFGSGAACAVEILDHESGTSFADVTIANPSSGAYGLPQALPGSKMAAFGGDWATNPLTQLRWMQSYVNATYGSICSAASHDLSTGTY